MNVIVGDHVDFINAINAVQRRNRIHYEGVQIKGHQDEHRNSAQLTWWEQRNVEMNDLAKAYMQQLRAIKPGKVSARLQDEGVSLTIDGEKITDNIIRTCHDTICSNQLIDYWNTSGRYPSTLHNHIDWDNMHKALNVLPLKRSTWLLKHITGYCATGKQMKRW